MLFRKKFECPFFWGIKDDLIDDFDVNDDYIDEDYTEGFIKLIKFITKAFILCKRGFFEDAMKVIDTVEKRIWIKYDRSNLKYEQISCDVVHHILFATKYCIYVYNERNDNAQQMLPHCKCATLFRCKIERATLHGCKSVVLSFFYEKTAIETIHHARIATMMEPNTALWHFMLGKSLRRLRRNEHRARPDAEEKQAFLRAEELNNTNAKYAIYVAQMLFEDNHRTKALAKYREISRMLELSSSLNVKMRLALGFMKCKKLCLAKACLDEVDKTPLTNKNPMLMFYKGMYWMRKNNFEDASYFFKCAAEKSQLLQAYLQSYECQKKYNKNFDPVPELVSLLPLYKKNLMDSQIILLHLGMTYYKRNELDTALGFFFQAIKLNSMGKNLKDSWDIIDGKPCNVYKLVLHIAGKYQMNLTEVLIVVNEVYEHDNRMWMLREADIKKILLFCEIVIGKRHIVKTRLLVCDGKDAMRAAKNGVKFKTNDDGKLIGAEWYQNDQYNVYRKIHEATTPIPEDKVMSHLHADPANRSTSGHANAQHCVDIKNKKNEQYNNSQTTKIDAISANDIISLSLNYGAGEDVAKNTCTSDENGPSMDSVYDPKINKLCSALPRTHSKDSGTGEDNTDAGNAYENGNDVNGDANGNNYSRNDHANGNGHHGSHGESGRNQNGNTESSDDMVVENIRIDEENRRAGTIDTPSDRSEIGDTNAGPWNESGNDHSADDCAQNGNQNGSARNDRIYCNYYERSDNDNGSDNNLDNVGETTQPSRTVCKTTQGPKPEESCSRPNCKGVRDFLVRIIKQKFR